MKYDHAVPYYERSLMITHPTVQHVLNIRQELIACGDAVGDVLWLVQYDFRPLDFDDRGYPYNHWLWLSWDCLSVERRTMMLLKGIPFDDNKHVLIKLGEDPLFLRKCEHWGGSFFDRP